MLSRVADSLYWMSRYIERAENLARILEVNLQVLLDLQKLDDKALQKLWEPVLDSTGDPEEFYKLYKQATTDTVIDFLTFKEENHNSILACISAARENARQVREQISNEMWEELNRCYLGLKDLTVKKIRKTGLDDFFLQVKRNSHLFQGITDATMTHGEGWQFIQAGKFLERADKTTRIIDAKHAFLQPAGKSISHAGDAVHWNAVLRSCSAHEAYRKVYVAQVDPLKVVEFLVLSPNFPRSIRACVQALDEALRQISGSNDEGFTNAAEKLSGRLVSELRYSSVGDVTAAGLHAYMDSVQLKLNAIGNAIYQHYMFAPQLDLQKEIQQQQQQ